jgi:cytochrome P450
VTFAEAIKLKYFQACIKEALSGCRKPLMSAPADQYAGMHPAVGLLLERVVPAGGAKLEDVFLPEGTVVGMNPWVAARDKSVYGDDAYEFKPERWLEADEQQLKLMERNFMAFGSGARTCLGKNISILEMSKLVPQILRQYDFELSHPDKEWKLHDYWFVTQTGLSCKVKRRHV